jgi:hypothetical protein
MKVKVRTQTIGITLIFLLLLVAAISPKPLSLLPGPEGAKVGVYSVQNPYSLISYVVGRETDPLASVSPNDPYNVRYDPDESSGGYPDLYVSLSNVWSNQEVLDKTIDYCVQRSDGTWNHITGRIHVVYFNVVFKAEPSSDAWKQPVIGSNGQSEYEQRWKTGDIWFATGVTVWDSAAIDPSGATGKTGRAWGTPISAYIISREVASDSSNLNYLNPEIEVGRQITLFSSPTGGSIADIIGNTDPTTGNLNSTVYQNWADQSPDSRMRQTGYFMFEPTDFGCQWWYTITGFGSACPKVQATVKMYYLIIGQFIYTQEEYQAWKLGGAKHEYTWWDYQVQNWNGFWAGVSSWIANPFNIAGLGLYGLLIVAVIAAVVLIYFFGPPRLKRRKGQ